MQKILKLICPNCGAKKTNDIIKNGSIHNGKPKYLCKLCHKQFVTNPLNRAINGDAKKWVAKCIIEGRTLRSASIITGVSQRWIQTYTSTPQGIYAMNLRSREILEVRFLNSKTVYSVVKFKEKTEIIYEQLRYNTYIITIHLEDWWDLLRDRLGPVDIFERGKINKGNVRDILTMLYSLS